MNAFNTSAPTLFSCQAEHNLYAKWELQIAPIGGKQNCLRFRCYNSSAQWPPSPFTSPHLEFAFLFCSCSRSVIYYVFESIRNRKSKYIAIRGSIHSSLLLLSCLHSGSASSSIIYSTTSSHNHQIQIASASVLPGFTHSSLKLLSWSALIVSCV